MARSHSRVNVEVSAVFPADEPLAVPVVRFLIRYEELSVLSSRLLELASRAAPDPVPEQLFLVRSSAIALDEIAQIVKELDESARFVSALRRRSAEESFRRGQRGLAETSKHWDHVRNRVGAHLDKTVILNALKNAADSRGELTFSAETRGFRFDHVHLVSAAALSGNRKLAQGLNAVEHLAPVVRSLGDANAFARLLLDPILVAYDGATGCLTSR